MSKETRTIRPFLGVDELATVLDETLLYFGQEPCLANQGITSDLSPHEFLLRPVSIAWAADDQGFESFETSIRRGAQAADIPLTHLALVVVASTPFLKVSEIVLEQSAADLSDASRIEVLTDGRRPASLSAPFSGFTVDAYLVLDDGLPSRPLRPHVKGTWLSWAQYRVGTSLGPALLPPTPLTDEIRDREDLPKKSVRYLYFGDHELLQPYADQEQPVFYVDEKLLAQMNARRRSSASRALQLQLAHDFTSAVVRKASGDPDVQNVSYDDLRSSLLGSVLRIAGGPGATPADLDRLLNHVREDPEYVIARTEHFIDVGSGFASMLEEGED